MNKMQVVIGSDHGGFNYKKIISETLTSEGYKVKDVGTFSTDSCDYPDFAKLACNEIIEKRAERGILVCGSGVGMSITANKVKGIRCALINDVTTAKLCRQHNNANVIALGERIIGIAVALDMVRAFLTTEFEGGRHIARIEKIE